MRAITRCPACAADEIAPLHAFDSLPAILFPTEPAQARAVATAPLPISACGACDHLFAAMIDEAFIRRLYSDWYHLYPFGQLESMNSFYREPFERGFAYLMNDGRGKRLLEIGCSDAAQLDGFIQAGFECAAVSPGAKPSARVRMIDAFYESHDSDTDYDCIVSRFNLEHVIDPDIFLTKVKRDLRPDGYLLVQVPNVAYFLRSGLMNVFAHEHLQYFNRRSLQRLLERSGFRCTLMQGEDAPSLICAAQVDHVRQSPRVDFARNRATIAQVRSLLRDNPRKRIVFYGAGLSLTALLYDGEPLQGQVHIVDDNVLLHGKCMPHTETIIEPFTTALAEMDGIIVVLLNPIYHERVLPKLAGVRAAVYAVTEAGIVPVSAPPGATS